MNNKPQFPQSFGNLCGECGDSTERSYEGMVIGCLTCSLYFHLSCVNILQTEKEKIDTFSCKFCNFNKICLDFKEKKWNDKELRSFAMDALKENEITKEEFICPSCSKDQKKIIKNDEEKCPSNKHKRGAMWGYSEKGKYGKGFYNMTTVRKYKEN